MKKLNISKNEFASNLKEAGFNENVINGIVFGSYIQVSQEIVSVEKTRHFACIYLNYKFDIKKNMYDFLKETTNQLFCLVFFDLSDDYDDQYDLDYENHILNFVYLGIDDELELIKVLKEKNFNLNKFERYLSSYPL